MEPTSVYPIDKNRELLYEATDAEGYLHKMFRLYADNASYDHVDIDVQIKYPDPEAARSRKRKVGEPLPEAKRAKPEEFATSDNYFKLLLRAKVERFSHLHGDQLIVAHHNDSALLTFKKLIDNRILSCPVIANHGFFGFVDVLDYVHYFTADVGEHELRSAGLDFWKVLERHAGFNEKKVADIIQSPKVSSHQALQPGYSLYVAFEMLARERSLHRIAIVDDKRKLVNLVTQSALLEFVEDGLPLLGPKRNKPLSLCRDLFHDVESISTDDSAMDGFGKMRSKDLQGVAVVDKESGRLVGNLSARDLRGIEIESNWFQRLFEPVTTFLREVSSKDPERPESVLSVLPTDTLEIVVKKIATYKVHRLYIIDSEASGKPVGVVTLKDVLKEIIS
eukprot:TRINITY_DN2047_c0_g2_i1.p2 TRINITY_DN2047_c0_g2~~TRINITY_DN2047_c0_g2_i1.p2  ORF type:complete len:420 (-),score=162.74 TRINITY_DN2047_c0_g2_i1:510-1688(-)